MADGIRIKIGLDGAPQVQSGLQRTAASADGLADAFDRVGTAGNLLGGLAGVIGGGLAVREFIQAADAVTVLRNQLQLATGSAAAAETAYDSLFAIAQRSRTSFTELGSTFAAISRATDGMGISQQRLLNVTEAIGNAMAISGGDAASMNAALVQLSQGMASGTLRGEELNSVMEQTPRLARALADGMGISVGKLRELGKEGKLTADAVLKALESQSTVLAREVQGSVVTVGQAMTQLSNSTTKAIGDFDRATGSTATLAGAIQSLATGISTVGNVIRENETAFQVLAGTVGGAAAVLALAKAVTVLTGAVAALGVALAANPAVLALLGIGAVGGAVAVAINSYNTSAKGIEQAIATLEEQNRRSEEALQRAVAGGRTAGADNIKRVMAERVEAIKKLRIELAQLQTTAAESFRVTELAANNASLPKGGADKPKLSAEQQRAANRELEKQRSILNSLIGVNDDYAESLGRLAEMRAAGKLTEQEFLEVYNQIIAKQPFAIKLSKEAADAARSEATAREGASRIAARALEADLARNEALLSSGQSLRDQLQSLTLTEEALTAQAVATMRAEAADLEWQAAMRGGDAALEQRARLLRENANLTEQIAGVKAAKAAEQAHRDAVRAADEEWRQFYDTAAGLLTNAIRMGGEEGWDYVKDYIESQAIHALVSYGVNGLGQMLGLAGAASGAGGGNNGWLSLLGTAGQMGGGWGSVASTLGGYLGFGSGAAAGGTAIAGSAYGQAVNAALAEYGIVSSTGTAAAGGTAAASSSAASAIPIIGWIIAAVMASKAAYEGGNTLSMLEGKTDYGVGKFEADKYDTLTSLGVSEKWAQILSGAPLTARLFGSKASVSGFGVGSVVNGDFVQEDRAPITFGANKLGGGADEGLQDLASRIAGSITLSAGLFGGGLTQGLRVGAVTDRDRENEVASLLGFFGANNQLIAGVQTGSGAFGAGGPGRAASKIAAEDLDAWISEQMPVLIIQGLQQSDLEDRFDEYFSSISVDKLTPEAASNMLATATAAQQLSDAFGPLGGVFDQFETASIDTIAKTAQAAGGFDSLASAADAYVNAFLTDTQRTAAATERLGTVLADVGLTMPDLSQSAEQVRAQWVAMVDAQDISTEAGRKAVATLLGLASTVDALAQASEQAQGRLDDAIGQVLPKFQTTDERTQGQYQAIATELRGAGVNVDVGTLIGASKDEIEAFATAFVQFSGNSIEAKTAVVLAAGALADLKDDAAEAAEALADRELDFQIELQRALGNEAAATALERQRELEALRLLNPALAQTKQFIYDAVDAAEAAARAQTVTGRVDSVVGNFLDGAELTGYLSSRISEILSGGGIDASAASIIGSTKEQVVQLFKAVGIDGQEAILDALPLWDQLQEALHGSADAAARFASDLTKFTGALKFSDLSPLSAEAQLAAAQSQYDSTLSKAQAGDETARADLTSVAQALLQEAQGAYASSGAYTAIFDKVISDLDALALSSVGGAAAVASKPGDVTFVDGPAGSSGGLSGAPKTDGQVIDFAPLLSAPALMEGFSSAAADRQIAKLEQKLADVVARLDKILVVSDANAAVDQAGFAQVTAALSGVRSPLTGLEREARNANGRARVAV